MDYSHLGRKSRTSQSRSPRPSSSGKNKQTVEQGTVLNNDYALILFGLI